jgi:probable F420-dependent oxidoreductase
MRFTLLYPFYGAAAEASWASPSAIGRIAVEAERSGFNAIAFTDHPAPSRDWLDSGGHSALDPFGALCFVAGVTSRIKLMTFVAIASYRNVFVLAKSAATVDLLSGGRLILGMGAGYLEREFRATGAQFEARAAQLDECVRVLPRILSGETITYAGRTFDAQDITVSPAVAREIPIWVGGNSSRTRRLVAEQCHGWAPLMMGGERAQRSGTQALPDLDELKAGISDLHTMAQAAGRDQGLAIQILAHAGRLSSDTIDGPAQLEAVRALASAGVTDYVVRPLPGAPEQVIDVISRYGTEVIAQCR